MLHKLTCDLGIIFSKNWSKSSGAGCLLDYIQRLLAFFFYHDVRMVTCTLAASGLVCYQKVMWPSEIVQENFSKKHNTATYGNNKMDMILT